MIKKSLLVLTIAAVAVMFLVPTVYAADPADEMLLKSKVYKKHKKSLVNFTHKMHNVDYKVPCVDCHHIYEGGKNVWTEKSETPAAKCETCHSEAKAPKAKKGEKKMPKAEQIKKYHYSAIHANCQGCHKDLKKAKKPTGPTTCKDCQTKKKK